MLQTFSPQRDFLTMTYSSLHQAIYVQDYLPVLHSAILAGANYLGVLSHGYLLRGASSNMFSVVVSSHHSHGVTEMPAPISMNLHPKALEILSGDSPFVFALFLLRPRVCLSVGSTTLPGR